MPLRYRSRSIAVLAAAVALAAPAVSPAAILSYQASLDGLQEVPPNASPATGSATVTIDTDANTLSYTLTFSGLTGSQTAAHIHGFSAPGVSSGVLHNVGTGSPKVGVWNYAEGQEADILAGLTYFNVHTSTFSGGEIRGQIVPAPGVPAEPVSWSRIKTLY